MLEFTLDESSLEGIEKRFGKRLNKHMRAALNDMRDEISSWLLMEQQKGSNGGWEPLKSSYEERKEREFPGQPILSRTGQMMSSYLRSIEISPKDYSVSVNYPSPEGSQVNLRARAHQEGREFLPARPFPVDDQGYQDFEDIAIRHFRNALTKTVKGD
jgi:hypothetical protein